MRSTAALIASLLPPGAAEQIRQVTGDRELETINDQLRPAANPELAKIARILPGDTPYQVMRTAGRLGVTDCSDVLAEVANAATGIARPGNRAPPHLRDGHDRSHSIQDAPARLAGSDFPRPPLTPAPGEARLVTPRPPAAVTPDAAGMVRGQAVTRRAAAPGT